MIFRNLTKAFWRFSRAAVIAPSEMYIAKCTLLSSKDLSQSEKDLLTRVVLQIHGNDSMYVSFRGVHYLKVGFSAVRCILDVLDQTRTSTADIQKILDFPCGYGRVLRFLKATFPLAEISGFDTDSTALGFCEKLFNLRTISYSNSNIEGELEKKYDLIWCGSLFTHLPLETTSILLRDFYKSLVPGGLCIFSVHGDLIAQAIKIESRVYGLSNDQGLRLFNDYKNSGYGFGSYTKESDYGISVVNQNTMNSIRVSTGDWSEVYCKSRVWDNHHDIYAFRKH